MNERSRLLHHLHASSQCSANEMYTEDTQVDAQSIPASTYRQSTDTESRDSSSSYQSMHLEASAEDPMIVRQSRIHRAVLLLLSGVLLLGSLYRSRQTSVSSPQQDAKQEMWSQHGNNQRRHNEVLYDLWQEWKQQPARLVEDTDSSRKRNGGSTKENAVDKPSKTSQEEETVPAKNEDHLKMNTRDIQEDDEATTRGSGSKNDSQRTSDDSQDDDLPESNRVTSKSAKNVPQVNTLSINASDSASTSTRVRHSNRPSDISQPHVKDTSSKTNAADTQPPKPRENRHQENRTSEPFNVRHSWDSLSEQVHTIWSSLSNRSSDRTDSSTTHWWQEAIDSEEAWRRNLLRQLRRYSRHVKRWWSDTDVNDKQQHAKEVLQNRFQNWWSQAQQAERAWWSDTVYAYKKFSQAAGNHTSLWWDLTKEAAREDWEVLLNQSRVGANWSQHKAATAYNWSREEFRRDWNWTQEQAITKWNTTSRYVSYQEAVWWNATRLWFEDHYASPNETRNVFLKSPLLYLNNSIAYQLMVSSYGWLDHSNDFFALQRGWDVQVNQAYCGLASVAAIINSLPSLQNLIPMDQAFDPYPYATQPSLLNNSCVRNTVVRVDGEFNGIMASPGGLTLAQVAQLIHCHLPKEGWKVKYRHLDDNLSVELVRAELLQALTNPKSRVMVNFDRKALDQDGWGHMSPVAAYSTSQDAFLIMDVAKYKYPPVWVPTQRLVTAMRTLDHCGEWEFPKAQSDLSDKYLYPVNEHDMYKALRLIGCQATYRGYIIVETTQTEPREAL